MSQLEVDPATSKPVMIQTFMAQQCQSFLLMAHFNMTEQHSTDSPPAKAAYCALVPLSTEEPLR